jgi:heparan-alpha-glucosaminide N-acetyltransferase
MRQSSIYRSIMLKSVAAMTAAPAIRRPDPVPQPRNLSVDAYRGFVMLLMMAEVLRLSRVAQGVPDNPFWQFLAWNQTHVAWEGASLHDLIQPSFSFLVGVALPYSIASRIAKGATTGRMIAHAVWRSLLLVALGIFLRSTHSTQTNFTFEDTLTQIGLGYTFLFMLGFKPPRWAWISLGLLLFGYWLAWALYPISPGSPFQAHWAKNANAGHAFDVWFLNLFPRAQPFVENRGGYLTLSFIPTLGTMILGLAAGRWLREAAPVIPYRKFLIAGAAGVAAGALLHFAGVCPVVKRIWTPSWTLFSGGLCFWLLALFCRMKPSHFLVVIGMNSIAAYLIAHLFEDFVQQTFKIHLGMAPFNVFGPAFQPLLLGMAVLATFWVILWWMYRRKLFLKI